MPTAGPAATIVLMILYFLRHASAGERISDAKRDERRPLDAEGTAQCGLMGRALAAMDVRVDVIVSSPLKRALQTASLVGNEIEFGGTLLQDAALRPDATFARFQDLLQRLHKAEAVLVVGHNPTLGEFLGRLLVAGGRPARVDLKKGAVAKVEVGSRGAVLQWCLTPRVVKSLLLKPKPDKTTTLRGRPSALGLSPSAPGARSPAHHGAGTAERSRPKTSRK